MIFITGDTHGEMSMKRLSNKNFPEGKDLTRDDYVIVCGDFGLIFHNHQTKAEKWWTEWLEKRPFTVLFVDGNHENHPKLQQLEQVDMFGSKVGKVADNVFHLRRGEVYTIDGKTILTMGGAESVDKESRLVDVSWWASEVMSYNEIDHALENLHKHKNKVDYIITHTCPKVIGEVFCAVKGHQYYGKLQDATAQFFDHVATIAEFKHWYFGHWHDDWNYGKYHMVYEKITRILD